MFLGYLMGVAGAVWGEARQPCREQEEEARERGFGPTRRELMTISSLHLGFVREQKSEVVQDTVVCLISYAGHLCNCFRFLTGREVGGSMSRRLICI